MIANIKEYMSLYLVLETTMLKLPLADFVSQVIEGGVTAIQLRDKGHTAKERYETALQLRELLRDRDILFIINNNVDMALAVGAHGVHIGVEDLPPAAVRKAFPQLIIGYSCNNEQDCALARASADYAGVGPVFFTNTKANLRPVLGIDGMQAVVENLQGLPTVAIGGINADTASQLAGCGNSGIAVSSAICASERPYEAALALRKRRGYLLENVESDNVPTDDIKKSQSAYKTIQERFEGFTGDYNADFMDWGKPVGKEVW
ncbi:MAG: thiamine phosphate synthase [Deferribacteraceae bacterium]|jgi:thiamine-phosphate pyrophosphorylase|nr:thiamine phosphate synthase [Deferribacteraceae bacterium]